MMNEKDLLIELIDNVKDNHFAIVEFKQIPIDNEVQKKQAKHEHVAFVKIRIIDENEFRLIELTNKGYRQVDDDGDDGEWFETLSTLLQEKSESFRQQMMKSLFSKLSNLE